MASVSDNEMQKLRRQIKQRYNLDILAQIYRIEFVEQGGRMYLHTDDRFKPYTPPAEKTEYILHFGSGNAISFKSEETLLIAFNSLKQLNNEKLAATVNGKTIRTFEPR